MAHSSGTSGGYSFSIRFPPPPVPRTGPPLALALFTKMQYNGSWFKKVVEVIMFLVQWIEEVIMGGLLWRVIGN